MPDDELRHDAQRALLIVWLILGCVSGLAVVAPLLTVPPILSSASSRFVAAKAAGGNASSAA